MLTLRGISSTVFAVRLDTKCCNIMFTTMGHSFLQVFQTHFHVFWRHLQVFRRRFPAEQGQVAGPRRDPRRAAAGRRWSTPLGGG